MLLDLIILLFIRLCNVSAPLPKLVFSETVVPQLLLQNSDFLHYGYLFVLLDCRLLFESLFSLFARFRRINFNIGFDKCLLNKPNLSVLWTFIALFILQSQKIYSRGLTLQNLLQFKILCLWWWLYFIEMIHFCWFRFAVAECSGCRQLLRRETSIRVVFN